MNKKTNIIIIITICIVLFFLIISIMGYKLTMENNLQSKIGNEDISNGPDIYDNTDIVVDSFGQYSLEVINQVGQFSVQALSNSVIDRIKDNSWKEGAPIDLEELAYVEITYWGFDEQPHLGELIVNREVADEVVSIFQDIYEARFPIEKIKLIDEYDANDDLSMEDNNTSAFCFRIVTGGKSFSKHSYGVAIDINPIQNPYVSGHVVSPEKGREYLNREDIRRGMVVKDDEVYNAFKSRGWTWGGEWNSLKDYQHFEKNIDINNN